MKKEIYIAPTCEIVEFQSEGILMSSQYNGGPAGITPFEDGDDYAW